MKKILIVTLIILIVLSIIVVSFVSSQYTNLSKTKKVNQEYEFYLDKQLLGTDVTTVINKATNWNEKNQIEKDNNGFFIQNDTNSIKVEVNIWNEDELKTYQMETIQKVGINGFIDNFNLIDFICSKIEYHSKTRMVSKIVFEQVKE